MNKATEVVISAALIGAAVGVGTYFYKTSSYKCKRCTATYKPSFGKWISGMNLGIRKYMKCPECGNWNLHERIRDTEHKDYLD